MSDNVNHPEHYEKSCSIECIDAMLICFGKWSVVDFCKLNAFKYIWRYKNKNGLEDLKKAQWYIRKGLEILCDIEHKSNTTIEQFDMMADYTERERTKMEEGK